MLVVGESRGIFILVRIFLKLLWYDNDIVLFRCVCNFWVWIGISFVRGFDLKCCKNVFVCKVDFNYYIDKFSKFFVNFFFEVGRYF